MVDRLASVLKPDDVYIHIGANTGVLAESILKKLAYRNTYLSRVVMFEPIPLYYEKCAKKFLGDSTCTVENLAISDDTEDKLIYASKLNTGYNKIFVEGMEIHPHSKFIVKCKTLSLYLKEEGIKRVKLIKIDTEGHDSNVLSGTLEFLDQTDLLPYIQYEGDWYPEKETILLNLLTRKYGYRYKVYNTDYFLIPPQENKYSI
jgi:FkbM family methyltransferase